MVQSTLLRPVSPLAEMGGGGPRAGVAGALLAAALAWTPAGCAVDYTGPARDYFASAEALAAAKAMRGRRSAELDRLIAAGLDVDHRGRRGMNLLKWALFSNCLKCFEALLEAGAGTEHFVGGRYTGGVSQITLKPVMDLAASANDPAFLALALKHGADPDSLDVYGTKTVIFAALLNWRNENVRLLVEAGADLEATNGNGAGPLLFAVDTNNYEIACYLLDEGADPSRENKWGYSVADRIEQYGDRVPRDQVDWVRKFAEKLDRRD